MTCFGKVRGAGCGGRRQGRWRLAGGSHRVGKATDGEERRYEWSGGTLHPGFPEGRAGAVPPQLSPWVNVCREQGGVSGGWSFGSPQGRGRARLSSGT